jgi:putative SOS response-associated peptidase YedK
MTASERELFDKFPYLEQDEYFDIHGYKKQPEIFPGADILAINNEHRAENVWWTIEDRDSKGVWCRTINAKSESVLHTPMFRDAFRTDRILVPATGLYEWQERSDGTKKRFEIWFDEPIFAFGGVARTCSIKGDERRCGVIMTTAANEVVARLHNKKQRQAVVIRGFDHEKWLDPSTPMSELQRMMRPLPAEETHYREVDELELLPEQPGSDQLALFR